MPLISMFQSPYPNPFSNQITMGFNLKRDMNFKINIFDLLGRRVNMIEKKKVSSGRIFINWDGKDLNGKQLSSGVYFAMPISSDEIEPIKFVLLKE